jgi:hypothetical protein
MWTHNPVRPDAGLDKFERRTLIFEAAREVGTHTEPRFFQNVAETFHSPFDFISQKSLRVVIACENRTSSRMELDADCKFELRNQGSGQFQADLDRFLSE